MTKNQKHSNKGENTKNYPLICTSITQQHHIHQQLHSAYWNNIHWLQRQFHQHPCTQIDHYHHSAYWNNILQLQWILLHGPCTHIYHYHHSAYWNNILWLQWILLHGPCTHIIIIIIQLIGTTFCGGSGFFSLGLALTFIIIIIQKQINIIIAMLSFVK